MNTKSIKKTTSNFLIIFILTILLASTGVAKKGGNGGGKPGGGDPPSTCSDVFPGFVYIQEATKKSPEAIYLASSDGCRREPIFTSTHSLRAAVMHVTEKGQVVANGYAGVVLWVDVDPGNDSHQIVLRVNFEVDENGLLAVFGATQLLPLPGGGVPAEDSVLYTLGDVWGDVSHGSLYTLIHRRHLVGGVTSTREWLIYNLNDPTLEDARELTNNVCPTGVMYPQFVPECYSNGNVRWDSSGSRIYRNTGNNDWSGAVRIDIDKSNGSALENWVFSTPELVYTGPNDPNANYGEPFGVLISPPSAANSDEFLAMMFLDRTGQHTVGSAAILNTDVCADLYMPLASGNSQAADNLWLLCIEGVPFVGGNKGRQNSWQSSDDLLISRLRNSRTTDIYRIHRPGKPDMSEILLIEGASTADSGF